MKRIVIGISLAIIIGLISGVTMYKVVNEHNDKLLMVEEKYIIEKTRECVNKKICVGDKFTLKELYEMEIMDKQVNRVTKEYYSEESYVEVEGNNYKFVIV